jgi:hypothetical protein
VIAGDGLLADTDVRHFRTDRDVKHWLTEEAGRRDFFQAVLVEWQTFPDQAIDPRFAERLAEELSALGCTEFFGTSG